MFNFILSIDKGVIMAVTKLTNPPEISPPETTKVRFIESLIKEIEIMLSYSDNYTGLSNEKRNQYNFYGKKIIEDLKKRWIK